MLDWGGSGRSVVLLGSQLGTAHQFQDFAPKLANDYHVYAITRRGIGASSVAEKGYDSDQLGDDIIAVLEALKLDKPLLLGVDFAAGELSSVGTRFPDKIGGLIFSRRIAALFLRS